MNSLVSSHPLYPILVTVFTIVKNATDQNILRVSDFFKFFISDAFKNFCKKILASYKYNINSPMDKYLINILYIQLINFRDALCICKCRYPELVSEMLAQRVETAHRQNFSSKAQKILNDWFQKHPSPDFATKEAKEELSKATGLTIKQVSTWLINKRRRSLK